jgi:4'-phosphopantetheinyl transferase
VTARVQDVLATLDRDVLSPIEQRRCAALRDPAGRDARAAAHLLVRWAAAELTGRPATSLVLVQRCADCGATDHGRPTIAGTSLYVSMGRTRGVVVAGAHHEPVGVDIEGARSITPPTVRASLLTSAEGRRVRSADDPDREFLHHWVLKECLVKVGLATLDTVGGLEVRAEESRRAEGGRTLSRWRGLHLADWFDERLDAVVGAAGSQPPLVRSLPVRRPT